MPRKETADITELHKTIQLFHELEIEFWIDGGWGVDILAGKQTRAHRDIDVNFEAAATDRVVAKLVRCGHMIETDWLPTRMELYHAELGFLDIHPFELLADGRARQADLEGGWWTFDRDFFSRATFRGVLVPCMSLKAQLVFHSGYEPCASDIHDLEILRTLESAAEDAACPEPEGT